MVGRASIWVSFLECIFFFLGGGGGGVRGEPMEKSILGHFAALKDTLPLSEDFAAESDQLGVG